MICFENGYEYDLQGNLYSIVCVVGVHLNEFTPTYRLFVGFPVYLIYSQLSLNDYVIITVVLVAY